MENQKKKDRNEEHLKAVLEDAPVAVFVSTVDGKKRLYSNRLAKELFQEADRTDTVCDTQADGAEPCFFCCKEGMSGDETNTVEYRNPCNQRIYQISRKCIEWAGEKAYIEYFEDITEKKQEDVFKTAEKEVKRMLEGVSCGLACYQMEGERLLSVFFSDGVTALSGHTREEYEELVRHNALDMVYGSDKKRVAEAVREALDNGAALDISYRIYHKNGILIWVHLSGWRMEPLAEQARIYAVFTAVVADIDAIVNEVADGVYIIDKESYELLYANESRVLSVCGAACVGKPCYESLHGFSEPCDFCLLKTYGADEQEHEIPVSGTDLIYSTRVKEITWNGIPAYIQYIRDVTEEVENRREKERMEMYFQTLIKNLPGGISVIRVQPDGSLTPEYISESFAAMTRMTVEESYQLYRGDVFAGVHPEDIESNRTKLLQFIASGQEQAEFSVRFRRGDSGYVWIRDNLTVKRMSDGIQRLYCVYTDITKEIEKKEQFQRRYDELIQKYYKTVGPETLFVGHANISQNKILEVKDYTGSCLLELLGSNRNEFFEGFSEFIVDEKERKAFLEMILNAPLLAAIEKDKAELNQEYFIKFPQKERGCYTRLKINLMKAPDTGEVIGILTISDITERIIADRILHQLSYTNHDYIIDLDIPKDFYRMLSCNPNAHCIPDVQGSYSKQTVFRAENVIVPSDRHSYQNAMEPDEICRRLKERNVYTFTFSTIDENGDVYTKNMTVSSIDLRLKRFCLVCTDITDSVRERQGLLNMIAYTFDLAGLIHVNSGRFTMYTRQMVLENLTPYKTKNYHRANERFIERYKKEKNFEEIKKQFSIDTMLQRLAEKPEGYDFVFSYTDGNSLRYKQVNVLWGDPNHETVCVVRADVTDMLAEERRSQEVLETALKAAEKANQAKSEFLSAMSHDIRTPMNAIMGMTTLALTHMNEPDRIEDCLHKISTSSKHLLSLVNDVLDISKIERSQIALNPMQVSLPELAEDISAIMAPQAKAAGLQFNMHMEEMIHKQFYGDSLRVNQILINILSNAVKFTPEGGRVECLIEEIPPVKDAGHVRYRFTVRDTGIGMPEEFLSHAFSPFARDTSMVRVEGTGLGLSITRGLVDLMGGDIFVESQVNKGTVFWVELEFEISGDKKEKQKKQGNLDAQRESFSGYYFLAAEDNTINAEILREFLAMRGAKVVIKSDGEKVVQAFEEALPGTYDVILMDIQMPVMNGFEAARAIRRLNRPDAKTIPIVAMTANAFAEDIQASLEAGMNAHIAKPLDVEVLRATLDKVLNV